LSLWAELNAGEFEGASKALLFLPLGSVEPHGPHLPMNTDTIISCAMSEELAGRMHGIVLPPLEYTHLYGLRDHPGGISASHEPQMGLLLDIYRDAERWGGRVLSVINGHTPSEPLVRMAQERWAGGGHRMRVLLFTYPGIADIAREVCDSSFWQEGIFHADEIETSLMLYLKPSSVHLEGLKPNYPPKPHSFGLEPVSWRGFSPSYLGDPSKATAQKGQRIFTKVVDNIEAQMRKIASTGI
jgi:creatinine amidohydrolase